MADHVRFRHIRFLVNVEAAQRWFAVHLLKDAVGEDGIEALHGDAWISQFLPDVEGETVTGGAAQGHDATRSVAHGVHPHHRSDVVHRRAEGREHQVVATFGRELLPGLAKQLDVSQDGAPILGDGEHPRRYVQTEHAGAFRGQHGGQRTGPATDVQGRTVLGQNGHVLQQPPDALVD